MNAHAILDSFENPDFAAYVPYALNKIKAGDALEAKLLASLRVYPVSIRECITHSDYLDQGSSIYPKVMDELGALNNPL